MKQLTLLALPLLMVCLLATFPFNISVEGYQPPPPPQPTTLRTFGNSETPWIATYNWSDFWRIFNKHSAWDLEVDAGLGWQSVKQDLRIIRNYTDAWTCKIALIFNASTTGNYRLTFGIDLRVRNYTYREADHRYVLTYQNHTVYFDWTDLVALPLLFSHGITEVDGIPLFWFRARRNNVPQGTHLELDPTFGYDTVGSSKTSFKDIAKWVGFDAPEDGTVTTISVYAESESSLSRWVHCAIYDSFAFFGTLYCDDCLGSGSVEIDPYYTGWANVTLASEVDINGGDTYCLVFCWSLSMYGYYDTAESWVGGAWSCDDCGTSYFCAQNLQDTNSSSNEWSLYATYYTAQPNIGEFESSQSNVYANTYFLVNATIQDASGIDDFVNATLELDGDIILKWNNATDTFSEDADPSGYCTLGTCSRTNLNSTAHRLSWNLSLTDKYPLGYVDVVLANTKVFDNAGNSTSNSKSHLFSFEGSKAGDPTQTGGGGWIPSQPIERPEYYVYEGPPEYYGPPSPTGPTVDLGLTAMVTFIGGMGVIGYVSQKVHRSKSRANLLKNRTTHKRGHPRKTNLKRASTRDYEEKTKTKR